MTTLPSAQRLDVKLRAAGRRPASSGAPLAAHPIMPVQVARRRANSRRGSRLGWREKQRRTVNFNDELGAADCWSMRCVISNGRLRWVMKRVGQAELDVLLEVAESSRKSTMSAMA